MKKIHIPWKTGRAVTFLASLMSLQAMGQEDASSAPAEQIREVNGSVEITTAMKDQALVQPNAEAYSREVERLRMQESKVYDFDRAVLADVLRALATDARLNYLALPESQEAEQTLVTIHLNQPPFTALETVANAYGVALVYEGGVWHMRPFDDKQLIARNYKLKYNLTEDVDFGGMGGMSGGMGGMNGGMGGGYGGMGGMSGGMGGGFGGMGGGYGGMGGGYGGGLGGGIGIGSTGIGVQKSADTILKNIEAILGIQTRGFNANVAPEADVSSFDKSTLMVPLRGGIESEQAMESTKKGESGNAAVAWNSDSNSFFVVATRQQHQWVEAYLTSLDKTQALIAIEIKFFETTRDPRSQLGVDWSQTLDGGFQLTGTGLEIGPIDLNESLSKVLAPQAAILSGADLATKIQFLAKDRDSQFTSYPRVLALNNRPVTIQSVVNQPILASSSSVTPGVGGTNTQSVAYMPIGTSIVLVPKRMDEGRINMHVQVIVSSITGSEIIAGNKYPVPSTRVYQSQLQVESGYTVAIAGLDEALDTREGTGIPILEKIPLAGWAFKNRFRDRTKKNMMMFITPTLMDASGKGISEKPISELPRYKGDMPKDAPKLYTDGTLVGGPTQLPEAIRWADREERRLRNVVKEGRADKSHRAEIARIGDIVEALTNYLPTASASFSAEQIELYRWQLAQLEERLCVLRSCYRKNHLEGLGYSRACD